MKLRFVDRLLLALGGLALMAVGVLVALAAGGALQLPEPLRLDVWIGDGWEITPLLFVVGVLLFVLGAYEVAQALRTRDRGAGRYYAVPGGGEGVHISEAALSQLAQKAVSERPEMLTSRIRIAGREEAVRISLRVTLRPGARIPEMTRQVCESVKNYMEQYAGVTVESVRLVVDAARSGGKAPEREPAPQAERAPAQASEVAADVAEPPFVTPGAEAPKAPLPPAEPETAGEDAADAGENAADTEEDATDA